MSLRDTSEQIHYENFCFDVIDACRAAGVEPPTDFAMRYYRGETLRDIVNERLVAAGKPIVTEAPATIPTLPRVTTQVRKLDPAIWGKDAVA